MRELPPPNYEYDVAKLTDAYVNALEQIRNELYRLDLTDFQRANALAVMKSITEILRELNGHTADWINEAIPKATEDGVIRAIIALGVVDTVEQAANLVKFNRINKELVKAVVADTQDNLLAVTQNMEKRIIVAIRKSTAEVMRANVTKGVNGTSTLTGELLKEIRKNLDTAADTSIINAAGARRRLKDYVEMVVRTKMMEAHKEATMNEAVQRGANYGVISTHGAKDACSKWEGKIVKLTPEAEGDYPYIGSLPNREIFHPNCRHTVSPVKRPDRV
ncbi:minor capsid protein [Listeria monocytogenes]|nr:minor capsid protein [Listeria monocytogenes]